MTVWDLIGILLLAVTCPVAALVYWGDRRLRRAQREWDRHNAAALRLLDERDPR